MKLAQMVLVSVVCLELAQRTDQKSVLEALAWHLPRASWVDLGQT
jgi:hypothetical protein